MSVMQYFPLPNPRKSQKEIILEIEKAFDSGYKNVIVEGPVGCGKSAIAVTFGNKEESSYIITPRKSLQNQYNDDFPTDAYLMKGRNAYPCIYKNKDKDYISGVLDSIRATGKSEVRRGSYSCAEGPCKGSPAVYKECVAINPCPYKLAIDLAIENKTVVHNFHSFIYQSSFAGHFPPRDLLIVDEAHEIAGVIRDFATFSIMLPEKAAAVLSGASYENTPPGTWEILLSEMQTEYSESIPIGGSTSPRDDYLERVSKFIFNLEIIYREHEQNYIFSLDTNDTPRHEVRLKIVPLDIGRDANSLLFNYGTRRLLMSGTVYSKELFCRGLGLVKDETYFIKVASSFNKKNRPIVVKEDLLVDTSHRTWDENYPSIVKSLETVLETYHDVKGLIHTPSYAVARQIYASLKKTGRVILHDKTDFQQVLNMFYESDKPLVLISPICQQGVDMKDDRARFQIILRVPYDNVSDPFTYHQLKKDFIGYNYRALITFGQQIGRVVRSDTDWGHTVLIDSRFKKFLRSNNKVLQNWLLEAVCYK